MSAATTTVSALRQLLSERFPQGHQAPGGVLSTGITSLDECTGGLPRHALTELICGAPSCGSQLFLGQVLQAVRQQGGRAALVDSIDAFDPASWPAGTLAHLVWVRGRTPVEAMAVTDLLARDANLDLVVLDLSRAIPADLRRITPTFWYRLQHAVTQTDLALLVLTPLALVPSAQLRLQLDQSFPLAAQDRGRNGMCAALAPAVQRQRLPTQLAAG